MEPRAMTRRVTLGNREVKHLASPGRRLVARIIDGVIVVVTVVILLAGIFGFLAGTSAIVNFKVPLGAAIGLVSGGALLLVLLLLIYKPTLNARRGQTLHRNNLVLLLVVVGLLVGCSLGPGEPFSASECDELAYDLEAMSDRNELSNDVIDDIIETIQKMIDGDCERFGDYEDLIEYREWADELRYSSWISRDECDDLDDDRGGTVYWPNRPLSYEDQSVILSILSKTSRMIQGGCERFSRYRGLQADVQILNDMLEVVLDE